MDDRSRSQLSGFASNREGVLALVGEAVLGKSLLSLPSLSLRSPVLGSH